MYCGAPRNIYKALIPLVNLANAREVVGSRNGTNLGMTPVRFVRLSRYA